MEVVLTRLRDFSRKAATFYDRKSAETAVNGGVSEDGRAAKGSRRETRAPGECGGSQLDIESALAWLRTELMEMRSHDQALIRKLMDLHAGIQELKLECAAAGKEEEEEEEEEEEAEVGGWDSGSEAGCGSVYSSSGEAGLIGSLMATGIAPPISLYHSGSLSRQTFGRRSSVP